MNTTWVRLCFSFFLAAATVGLVAGPTVAASASPSTQSGCEGHYPTWGIQYAPGCTGHDEPELDPVSSAPGSGQNATWTVVLPTDGTSLVSDTGPTFWFGGPVDDPASLGGQAFVELQFYPDSYTTKCTPNGDFFIKYVPNLYTVCSPVWAVTQNGETEYAAFNAMLETGGGLPLQMRAGDTIKVHWFVTSAKDGWHVTVTDLATGRKGTIVLNSPKFGPMMPAYNTDKIGNSLYWGIVHDAPIAFVWEIGHAPLWSGKLPPQQFCVPGEVGCDSYNAPSWAGTSPIQIESVKFGNGSLAHRWAVVSDYGGAREVNQYCPVYGQPYCIYPWYSSTRTAFNYGVDYPNTVDDYGQVAQFATTLRCGGPYGVNSTYCATVIRP